MTSSMNRTATPGYRPGPPVAGDGRRAVVRQSWPQGVRPRRRSGKAWIPGVVIVLLVLGGNIVSHLHLGSASTPSGVAKVVEGYYTAVEAKNTSAAKALICPTRIGAWTSGQQKPTGDLRRGITDYHLGQIRKDGKQYVVDVSIDARTGPQESAITVISRGNGYALCGGTSP